MSRQWRSDDTAPWTHGFGNQKDGNLSLSTTTALAAAQANFNTVAAGNTGLTLSTASTFSDGDLVILIQMMGTSVGAWELNKIVSGAGTTSIVLEKATVNTYTNTGSPTAGTPNNASAGAGAWSRPVILEMKEYEDVVMSSGGTLNTPTAWDGELGGIGGFFAKSLTQTAGTISASARGYRAGSGSSTGDAGGAGGEGGLGRSGNGGWTGSSVNGQGASGGGGAFVNNTSGGARTTGYMGGGGGGGQHVDGQGDESAGGGGGGGHYFGGGGGGAGTDANGSGGAGGASDAATGGGGGGSGTNGNGGNSGSNGSSASTSPARGRGGSSGDSGEGGGNDSTNPGSGGAGGGGGGANVNVADTELKTIFMGGGGGGGGRDNDGGGNGGAGGVGGGIWFIFVENINITGGAINVNGADGAAGDDRGGGGGGGAGGSVLIKCVTGVFGTNLIVATGGSGNSGGKGGGGGAGSRGIIHVDYSKSISGTTNPTISSRLDSTISSVSTGNYSYFM